LRFSYFGSGSVCRGKGCVNPAKCPKRSIPVSPCSEFVAVATGNFATPIEICPIARQRRRRLGFCKRKYLRTNWPSRAGSGAPQARQFNSRSRVSGPALPIEAAAALRRSRRMQGSPGFAVAAGNSAQLGRRMTCNRVHKQVRNIERSPWGAGQKRCSAASSSARFEISDARS